MNNVVVIQADHRGLDKTKKQISALTAEARNLQQVAKLDILMNTDKLDRYFAKSEKLIKKLSKSKCELFVTVEDRLLNETESTIKRLTGKRHAIHVDVNAGVALTSLKLLERKLNTITVKAGNLQWLVFQAGQGSYYHQQSGATHTWNSSVLDMIGPTADVVTIISGFKELKKFFSEGKGGKVGLGAKKILDSIGTRASKSLSASRMFARSGGILAAGGEAGAVMGAKGLTTLGAGTAIGGITAVVGGIEGSYHLTKGITANNDYDRSYEITKGGTVLGSTLAGVAAGSIFGLPGALIGGGVGYVAGKAASSPVANAFTGGKVGAMKDAAVSPNAARRLEELREKQAELAKSTLDEKFGSITLSAEQVAKATENLFNPTQTARIYNAEVAATQLNEAFGALQQSNSNLRKDIWTASTEGQLSPQKVSDLKTSANAFGTDAQTALKEKQYADKEAVLAVMGNADESESVLKSIDNRYKSQQTKLNKMETKLNTVINNASADGKISEKEQSKIDAAMTEIDSLIKNNSGDEFKASLEKMDLDIKGDINWESFRAIIESGKLSADQKVDSLENAYSNIASSATDGEKKTLLWGENEKGDKAGLYYQESGMYLDVINSVTEGFMERFAGNFDYFSESIDKIMQGGLNDDAIKQISSLYENDGAKKALGELTDGLSSSAQELLQIAQVYEDATGEVPKKIQETLKQLDFYNYVADDKANVWLKENGGKNANKEFNLVDYMYMGQPSLQPMPQTVPQTIPQDGFAYSSGLPQAPQVTLDGKSIIEGQSSITAADFGIPPFITTTVDVYVKENRIIGDPPKGAGGVGSTIASAGYTLMEGAKKVLKKLNGFRGGIVGGNVPGFAEGGYVQGGAQLVTVAEEGTPEAIIPLGKHRRKRAMELFGQVGSYLQAPGFAPKGFAAGGIVGGSIGGGFGSGMPTVVEVGGVEIKVEAKDGQNLVETIRENKEAISEEIAGVFNAAFKGQFANTPASGGAIA